MADIIQRYKLDAKDNTKGAFRSANRSLSSLQGTIGRVVGAYVGLHTAVSGITKLISVTSAYQNYDNRLKLVADTAEGVARAHKDIFKVSQETRSALGPNIELYARMGIAMKDVGIQHEELIGFNKAVALSAAISGSSLQEYNSSVIQLSQGMASGELRGQEYRSVLEGNASFIQALGRASGKTQR